MLGVAFPSAGPAPAAAPPAAWPTWCPINPAGLPKGRLSPSSSQPWQGKITTTTGHRVVSSPVPLNRGI